MYNLALPTAALAVVAMTNKPVVGFSTLSGVPHLRSYARSRVDIAPRKSSKTVTMELFGILDDILQDEIIDNDDSEHSNFDSNEQLVELYHSLIFASDLQTEISTRMDECNDPEFLEYLNASLQLSQDEEECQGLTELIDQINEVERMTAKKVADDEEKAMIAFQQKEEIEKESQATSPESTKTTKAMSNADVLRKANEIDAAIALSDDEKPSDFISDCREVVNLSGGFNDSGRMRVGG